nr:uncharacterized protein LOC111994820 [Quercus suber]
MVDEGSATEVMYPNLFRGLNLKPKDLTAYSSPLVGFKGRSVISVGMIRLPVQTGSEVVEVDFIVVDAFSPYTAILGRPWLHDLGAVSSTLHQKVKYPSEGQVGPQLPSLEKEQLVEVLRRNIDMFAWDAYEVPQVDPDFICHHLNVNPSVIPKKQPSQRLSRVHAEAIKDEVTKLKQAGAIKEGYHQIPLALDDQEKTVFLTPTGNYHYKIMPFGLKHAGSTFQQMMTKMFEPQLGRSIEVYIDDMVVKSKVVAEHVIDLTNTFEVLRKHKLRLNASKCSFGVSSGKFLGYMMTHRGIEIHLPVGGQVQTFFLLLHKWKGFEWTEECALAFQQLKEYLSRPPIMSSPEVDKVLFSYLAIATYAISFVLIRVDNGIQRLVYYVSKSLHEAEVRYMPLEKAILAVVHATRKLPYYFQAHTVVVLTQYLLKAVLQSADYTGRIAKWGTILGAFDIKYMPRTSVKGQVLADLVADFAEGPKEIGTSPCGMDEKSVGLIFAQHTLPWKVYVDGVANQRGSGVGLVLTSPEQVIIEKSLRLGFSATNNEAEYETLLMGMAMVRKLGGKTVEIFSDSKLIVGQVRGELEAWDTRMQEYLSRVRRLQVNFESFEVTQVPRSKNAHADSLATLATSSAKNLPRVIMVEDLNTPTPMTGDSLQVNQIRSTLSWMDPIKLFLEKDILPEDKSEAEKIRRKAPQFWLSEDKKLYKRSYSGPYLLYVHPEASEALLEELHEGICGSHTGGRSLSHRAIT